MITALGYRVNSKLLRNSEFERPNEYIRKGFTILMSRVLKLVRLTIVQNQPPLSVMPLPSFRENPHNNEAQALLTKLKSSKYLSTTV